MTKFETTLALFEQYFNGEISLEQLKLAESANLLDNDLVDYIVSFKSRVEAGTLELEEQFILFDLVKSGQISEEVATELDDAGVFAKLAGAQFAEVLELEEGKMLDAAKKAVVTAAIAGGILGGAHQMGITGHDVKNVANAGAQKVVQTTQDVGNAIKNNNLIQPNSKKGTLQKVTDGLGLTGNSVKDTILDKLNMHTPKSAEEIGKESLKTIGDGYKKANETVQDSSKKMLNTQIDLAKNAGKKIKDLFK